MTHRKRIALEGRPFFCIRLSLALELAHNDAQTALGG